MIPADRLPGVDTTEAPLAQLSGVRVLDLTTSIAGPYCTQLLGDFGASIVKIERPGAGDDARAWGPPFLDGESLWFMSVNRNKRSVALDWGAPEGLATLHELVRVADVVVVNLVGRIQKKLGVDAGRLRALNPRLIHVSITGFGLSGEGSDRPCYDLIAEGHSGVMDLTGEADSAPQKVGTPAADLLAGADAAMAVLAALVARSGERDGERNGGRGGREDGRNDARNGAQQGATIDVSMVRSMTRFMLPRVVSYLGSGEVPARSGGKDSVIAIYQTFDTADEPLTLGLGNDGIFRRFCEAIGRRELAEDPRFASNAGRREHRGWLVGEFADVLKDRPRAHWLSVFEAARIPAGPINRLDQLLDDPTVASQGFLYATREQGRVVPQVGLGIRIDGSSNTFRGNPPRLGEHTEEVLREWLNR
ncbi:MAG TPA: CoA transferase [Burkholderiaceae bacterium]|nr:CoA transferase [Burkholderiaceae bacterium]